MLVTSDQLTDIDKDRKAVNKVKGDLFMLIGATLYGLSQYGFPSLSYRPLIFVSLANAAEEFLVRQSPLYEVVGQLGMWATLISGIQAAGLEYKKMGDATWNGPTGEFPSAPS